MQDTLAMRYGVKDCFPADLKDNYKLKLLKEDLREECLSQTRSCLRRSCRTMAIQPYPYIIIILDSSREGFCLHVANPGSGTRVWVHIKYQSYGITPRYYVRSTLRAYV